MEGESVELAGKGSGGRKITNDNHFGTFTSETDLVLTEVRMVMKMFKNK